MIRFPHLLLASKSPRRHQLLRDAGFSFTYIQIDAEENFDASLRNQEVCEYLAAHKSKHFEESVGDNVLVTADTIVVLNREVINKPESPEHAFEMLKKLSGNMHEVYTGVCLRNDYKISVFSERSEVWFHELTDEEIWYYIEHFKPFDKAGAYGVQDWMGYVGVKKINGCFYNVMGFPVSRFYREIQQF